MWALGLADQVLTSAAATQGCGRFCCPALSPANISVYLSTINVPPLALSQSCPHWQPRPTPHLWTCSISPSSELRLFVVGYIAHLSNSNRNNSLRFLTISPRAKRFVSVPSHLLREVSVREFTGLVHSSDEKAETPTDRRLRAAVSTQVVWDLQTHARNPEAPLLWPQ